MPGSGSIPPAMPPKAIHTATSTEKEGSNIIQFRGRAVKINSSVKAFLKEFQAYKQTMKHFVKKKRPVSITLTPTKLVRTQAKNPITKKSISYGHLRNSIDQIKQASLIENKKAQINTLAKNKHITYQEATKLLEHANKTKAHLERTELKEKTESKGTLLDELEKIATSISSVKEAVIFKRELLRFAIDGKISSYDKMVLQGKLSKQLRLLAQTEKAAQEMTFEKINYITSDKQTSNEIRAIVVKKLKYMPHKDTFDLDARLYRLKKKDD